MEGRLVTHTFEKFLARDSIGAEEALNIRAAIQFAEEIFDGLGFCLSEKPDLLSQWRGYANDGQGFSIGFSKTYFDELAKARDPGEHGFRLCKVLYDTEEHEAALKPTYDSITELVASGNLKKPKLGLLNPLNEEQTNQLHAQHQDAIHRLWARAAKTFASAHVLKNKAFSEEAEWRLISYLSKEPDDIASFRASGNRLIPYRELKLKQLAVKSIDEVYIGPKNITPHHVVEKFLALNGFPEVSVKRSEASYR